MINLGEIKIPIITPEKAVYYLTEEKIEEIKNKVLDSVEQGIDIVKAEILEAESQRVKAENERIEAEKGRVEAEKKQNEKIEKIQEKVDNIQKDFAQQRYYLILEEDLEDNSELVIPCLYKVRQ